MKSNSHLPNPILSAERLLAKAKIEAAPVDLGQVASLWSNLFIVEEELDGTGFLLPIGELGAEILIKKDDIEERKRFTIAHELGHWVLGLSLQKKIGHFAQPKLASQIETERWCDAFATNILMPRAMVVANMPQEDPVLAIVSIADAASRFKVSEEAFFIRLWELLSLQVAFVTLAGSPPERTCSLERSFASKTEELALDRFLSKPNVAGHLESSEFPVFSISSEIGKIKCAGRRISSGRLMLVLKWPNRPPDTSSGI